MSRASLIIAAGLLAGLTSPAVLAEKTHTGMERKGDMHIIQLSVMYNFHAVLEMLQIQLFDRGWRVRNVHDVDLRLRKLGRLVHDKVITGSKPEYVEQAVETNLRGALVVPTDIVLYESYRDVQHPWSYRTSPGTIEIAFMDPAAKAQAVGLEELPDLDKATAELREAVEATVTFFINASTVPEK